MDDWCIDRMSEIDQDLKHKIQTEFQPTMPYQKNVPPAYRQEKVSKLELELQAVEELKKELEHLEKTTVDIPEEAQGGDKPLDFESFKQLYLNMKRKGSLK